MNTVQEEIGYKRYNLSRRDTFAGRCEKIKIEYIAGMMKGTIVVMRRDFAEELIKNGKAIEVK